MGETICLDFDGVLHSYTSRWQGASVIPDPPTAGAQSFCAELIGRGFDVVILSTRTHQVGGREAMASWLKAHEFPSGVRIAADGEKPPAMVYVDDRGYRFTGDFDAALRFIGLSGQTPKPWNKPQ